MMTPSAPDLSALRQRLTKMTDRILMRLHDRAGFPLNRAVYEPGRSLVSSRPGVSLFDFSLEGLETYHASLGRYAFPDQYPLSDTPRPAASTRVEIPLRAELVAFYTGEVLPRLCEPAEDPGCFGETAYVDADLVELLNERINVGRDIALAKVQREPDVWAIVSDEAALRASLIDEDRARLVVAEAAAAAERYGLDPALARFVFEWIVERTLTLEVEFLRRLSPAH